MAISTTTFAWTNTTDADFRAWGSWVSTRFSTFGWTLAFQSFATGTSWANVTKPAATNVASVTEVWAAGDSLQSIEPLFIKIEYGASVAVTTPGLRLEFANGHSGGGAMTGSFHQSTWVGPTANTNLMTHYASGDTARITLMLNLNGASWSPNSKVLLTVERRKNGLGVDQGTGWLIGYQLLNIVNSFLTAGPAKSVTVTNWPHPAAGNSPADLVVFGKVQTGPLLFNGGGIETGLGVIFVPNSEAVESTISVSLLGSAHTYLVSKWTSIGSTSGIASSWVPAFRYE